MIIPCRQAEVADKKKRFYVFAPSSVYLALQEESFKRETDVWTLCGLVLASWVAAGFPDQIISRESSE